VSTENHSRLNMGAGVDETGPSDRASNHREWPRQVSCNCHLSIAHRVEHATCVSFGGQRTTHQKDVSRRRTSATYSRSLFSPVDKAAKIKESHLVTPGNFHMRVTTDTYARRLAPSGRDIVPSFYRFSAEPRLGSCLLLRRLATVACRC
jgi:hypothetical protein